MRRTITIAEPIHHWIQKIRGWYLQEHGTDMNYTGAINYFLAWGLCSATGMSDGDREKFITQALRTGEFDMATIQDEFDNLWLKRELPKLLEKAQNAKQNKEEQEQGKY